MGEKKFVIGVEGLERLVGEIEGPYTLLIMGNPGSGKTTLAAMTCYRNALRGYKSLYLSVYEGREQFVRHMKRIGIDVTGLGDKFKFYKLPLLADVDALIDEMNKLLAEDKYDIVVIDSVTALLSPYSVEPEKRGLLINYFYQIPRITGGGLLIMVHESPVEPALSASGIEFITDGVIVLKSFIEDGFMVRLMEIQKLRGNPVNLAQLPYDIVEGEGIVTYIPPLLELLPPESEEIYPPCSVLRDKVDHVHKNFLINIFYPPLSVQGIEALVLVAGMALIHKFNVLVISYVSPPILLKEIVVYGLTKYFGLEKHVAEKLVDKYLKFYAINPFAQTIWQTMSRELQLIESASPDIVVFHGTRPYAGREEEYVRHLYNEILYLKSKNIGIIRIGSHLNPVICNFEQYIADLNIIVPDSPDKPIILSRRFQMPVYITIEDYLSCIREMGEIVRRKSEELLI